jgi:hypothetical protein
MQLLFAPDATPETGHIHQFPFRAMYTQNGIA